MTAPRSFAPPAFSSALLVVVFDVVRLFAVLWEVCGGGDLLQCDGVVAGDELPGDSGAVDQGSDRHPPANPAPRNSASARRHETRVANNRSLERFLVEATVGTISDPRCRGTRSDRKDESCDVSGEDLSSNPIDLVFGSRLRTTPQDTRTPRRRAIVRAIDSRQTRLAAPAILVP